MRHFCADKIANAGEFTYKEIGEILGVSAQRVRIIERSALIKLSHPKNRKILAEIVDILNELYTKERTGYERVV